MTMKTLALAAALCLVPSLALAQAPPSVTPPQRSAVQFRGAPIPVDGRVPRPFFWVLARTAPQYVPAPTPRSFAPPVVHAVRRDPF